MEKKIRKYFVSLLAVMLVMTGFGYHGLNVTSAYAKQAMTPTFSIYQHYSKKAGDCGSNTVEAVKDPEGNVTGFNIYLPDTTKLAMGQLAEIKNAVAGTTYAYYTSHNKMAIKRVTNPSKIVMSSDFGPVVPFIKDDTPKDYTLTFGEYDTRAKKLKEGTTKTYTVSFRKRAMLSGLTVSFSVDDSNAETTLKLNPTFSSTKEQTYGVCIPKDATKLTISHARAAVGAALATYGSDGKVLTPGVEVKCGDKILNETTESFNVNELPTNGEGKQYVQLDLHYVKSDGSESTTYGKSSYQIIVETGDYTPTVTCDNDDCYEYNRGEETVTSLSVTAGNSQGTTSYQWYRNLYPNIEGNDYQKIEDATQPTYTPPVDYIWDTAYRCKVINTVSGVPYSVDSKPIRVKVKATSASVPEIKTQPTTEQECLRGETVKLSVSASTPDAGAKLQYQWYEAAGKESNSGTAIEGATSETLQIQQNELGSKYYYCNIKSTVAYTLDDDGKPQGGFSAERKSNIATVKVVDVPGIGYFQKDDAAGTAEKPYKINTLADLKELKSIVEKGYGLSGIYFKLESNIGLPSDWSPIGNLKEDKTVMLPNGTTIGDEEKGKNVNPFMATFDGDGHTITIPSNGKALFKYVREATIKNLNVLGEQIDGSAFISNSFVDYGKDGDYKTTGVERTVTIDNCRLLNGSKTSGAGFLPGSGSGKNKVYILNSTVEKNVIIGNESDPIAGGSFIGALNGQIVNCVSYATVYGQGGLAGHKGESMGACTIANSAFLGKLISNTYAGGIIGSGYNGYGSNGVNSAPNTPVVAIRNCYVVADITGVGNVGGILGTEPSCECCWSNGKGTISNNYFKGTLTETSGKGNVGGVAGFLKSFDKYQGFDDNFYEKECGAKLGIGKIETIITKSTPKYGAAYGIDYEFDENKVCTALDNTAFSDSSLAAKLNAGKYSTKNWKQGEDGYPVLSADPIIYQIELSGNYTTEYKTGEAFDTTGMVIIGTYTDGKKEEIPIDKVKFSKLDSSKAGNFEITASYLAAETKFTVEVRYENPKPAKVSITILGDTDHGDPTEATGTHTLRSNNLPQQWYTGSFDVNQNNTVWDILQLVTKDTNGKISFSNPSGNYVDYVTYNGLKLGEFTNGKLSGWMYTLNGTHPNLGVSEQFLNPGDRIIWHYTDDYTKEEGSDKWGVPGADEVKNVTTSGAAGSATTTAPTEVKVSGSTATATVKAENQSEILKQAVDKKSTEIILEVSKADSKSAENVQLTLDTAFVKNISEKTDADLTVNTENGKVTLDQETIKTVLAEAKGATITLEVTKVAKPTEAQKKAAGANGHLLKLTIKSGDKVISDFNKGKVKVVAEIVSKLLDKKVAAIHIADDGKIEQLAGKVLTIGGKKYFEFTTPHFSTFALVDADELGLEVKEEPAVDVKTLTAKLTPVARSAKTAKKNVKVTVSLDKQDKAIIKELKDTGYTVKYRFYRSTKKAAGYKAAVTKKTAAYTNTGGKKGTKYYYKVQVRVYDENGKLAAKTALKQCRYAARVWSK